MKIFLIKKEKIITRKLTYFSWANWYRWCWRGRRYFIWYDRYSVNNIRKEVLEDLTKKNNLNSKMDIDEEEFVTKDYDYYKYFSLFE